MTNEDLILYLHRLFTKNKINFLLDCGQLLIAYRDGKVNELNSDDDFDFGIDRKDLQKVKNLILADPILKPISKIKKIWKSEISIKVNKYQIDFYAFDYDENYFYNYWYAPNPKDNEQWTLGYRVKFPKDVYMPFQKFTFLGVEWQICHRPEEKFTLHYGEWRVNKPGIFMGIHNIPCVDPNYRSDEKDFVYEVEEEPNKIGVILTTFLRDDVLQKTLEHYSKFSYRIYLIDQGKWTKSKEAMYEQYREKGHKISYAPFDCGLSYARNMAVEQVVEPFIFLTDDDIHIRRPLTPFLQAFDKDQNLGFVGGKLFNHATAIWQLYSHNMKLENGVLTYSPVNDGYCDIVLNFFLARTEIFKEIRWDDRLKMTEHTDFFLRLKKETNWKVYYEPELIGDHYPIRPREYSELRSRPEFYQIFKMKHSINEVQGLNG